MNNLQLSVLLSSVDKMSAPVKGASKSVAELSKKLKESKAIRDKLTKADAQNEAAIKKYAAALNPLKNKLAGVNQELLQAQQKARHYAQQLANAKAPTDAFRAKAEGAKNAVAKLKQEQTQLAAKLRQTRQELNKSGISAQTLGQKQDLLRSKLKGANQQIAQQQIALRKLNTQQAKYQAYRNNVTGLRNSSDKARMLGAQSIAAGAAITAPSANAVKNFMDFEDAMIGVARQVDGLKTKNGDFTKEFDAWKLKIQALSKELPLTTVQIANMIESAARMDIAKDELEDFVRLNTQMAIAFDAQNPDELVEQFGKVSKNFRLSINDTKELADTINWLDDNAISKGTGIIGYMNRVAGISSVAKISAKNMAALGSTLQTLGAPEEDSATAVTTIFTRLGVAGNHSEVDAGLKKLGLDPTKIAKGMANDAQETLMLIIERMKKLKDEDKLDVMKGLAGIPHIKTISKLVDKTDEWKRQIALANDELAKDSMNREFVTRMKAISADWGIFKNRIFNVSTAIGGTLAPILKSVMQTIGGIADKFKAWIEENPKFASYLMTTAAVLGTTLTLFGAFAAVLGFVFYPAARVVLGLSKLNILLPRVSKNLGAVGGSVLRGIIAPLRTAMLLFSPWGAAIAGVAFLIFKYWQPISAFFGGVFQGLKEGLAPVIAKFQPLADVFGVLVGWIADAFKWIMDLISPVKSTSEELDKAASAGKKFGEWLAAGIDLVTKPLQWVMDGIKWVIDNMPSLDKAATTIISKDHANQLMKTADMAAHTGFATGGYTGHGGKYDVRGFAHANEYVFSKDATSRLGVGFLNTLHNAKSARAGMLATGLMSGFATAQPIRIDSRPPLTASAAPMMIASQPMQVTININASAGQNTDDIARAVQRELARLEQQRQAKARSRLYDRE